MPPARPSYWPQRVFVTRDASDDALTQRVLSRLGDVEVVHLDRRADPVTETDFGADATNDASRFDLGKRTLLLTRHEGGWMERCPAGSGNLVCCNLWTVNPGEGCPLDCSYCYLQSYLKRNPTLKLFTNIPDMLSTIEAAANAEPSRLFRIGTGETIDSLVWDPLTDLSSELVPLFGRLSNALLELKTKTALVDQLVDLRSEHNGRTVVSWSLNARVVTEREEVWTAALEDRILAAARCVEAGYRVGFHFDPLIDFDGWQDAYRETVDLIFASVPASRIAWISLGTLRYKREMQQVMRERFPKSTVSLGEQQLGSDNKMRYCQPMRLRLLRFMWDSLKERSADLPVYMCMEGASSWRAVSECSSSEDASLVEIISRKGRTDGAAAEGVFLQ